MSHFPSNDFFDLFMFSCNLVIETFQLKLSNEMFPDSVSPVLVSTVMAERHNDSGNYDCKKRFCLFSLCYLAQM